MLTKKLKFEADVLDALRRASWSADGRSMTMPPLDRKLYVRVNKALELLGGEWQTRAKAHVFETDPRPEIEGFLETGELEKTLDGFFRTPRAVVDQMFTLLCPVYIGYNLEPSAGDGAIADRLSAVVGMSHVQCVEIDPARCLILRSKGYTVYQNDFLQYPVEGWMRVYMNPPFERSQDIQHVLHAHKLLAPHSGAGLVAVMSEGAFFHKDKWGTQFRAWLASTEHRVVPLASHAFRESGTDVATRLVMVMKE